MSKSKTCDVLVRLPHGVILNAIPGVKGMALDSADRLYLEHGFNESVDRGIVERWIARNQNLAAVKRGDIRILDHDVIAVDSSKPKK